MTDADDLWGEAVAAVDALRTKAAPPATMAETPAYDGCSDQPEDGAPAGNIECRPLNPVGVAAIPPRQWAYGRFLLFGSAAVLGAVDGGGKGAIAVAMALAMITGKPLLGERVWRTGSVAIVTFEDDETEWHRRIAAACLHYELDYHSVIAGIHFLRKPEGRICFAAMSEAGPVFPDGDRIIEVLKSIGAALLIVDPFNHAHAFDDGNNNVAIAKIAGELSRIAREAEVAALTLHHVRKGSGGTADDLMGATSLRATFRSARILARMDAATAERMGVTDAWRYSRIAGTKENYAPPPERATWFRLASVPLGNGTDDYPEGDNVAVATTWQPRPMFEGMSAGTLRAVFAELEGNTYGPTKQAKNTPWAGKPLMEIGGRSEREAGRIVTAWLESGVLAKGTYYHAGSRHEVGRVVLDAEKTAEIVAEVEAADVPE